MELAYYYVPIIFIIIHNFIAGLLCRPNANETRIQSDSTTDFKFLADGSGKYACLSYIWLRECPKSRFLLIARGKIISIKRLYNMYLL